MGKIAELFARYGADNSGASAIEYALLVAMAAGVIGLAYTGYGSSVSGLFTKVNTTLNNAL